MEIIMFPGQGSQQLGMGKTLFAKHKNLCSRADDTLGYSISRLCLEDPKGQLNQTAFTQPALYFVCCLMYLELLEREGDRHNVFVGHSLGLYPALFAAGVFDLITGLHIVAKRGELMQSVVGGGMMVVLGNNLETLPGKLIHHNFFDIDVANHNSPDQVVLSGKEERMTFLLPLLEKEGFRCILLPVSGAFHSRYMESSRLSFMDFLMTQPLSPPQKIVISSTSGETLTTDFLLEEMGFQLVKPVRWFHTIQRLINDFPQAEFREIGPGKVLTGIHSKIFNAANSAQKDY
ncbi:acyltransferase domain-containing protein [Xenorhabdus sp. KJ12.1]|uniref:acyltransferase domain-containing protein n=1 Tax=Xenorhabdus sp. KJ12.1 TaxID=1851571 RepID=UPI000C057A1A|nr:acyltransferase domain-containing protein [Xenorhabdus sp. KJ12.1]PHM67146.1 Phthiocerol synthesis polyketide synthase type I PpsE [Xenorhabdus sp. KJ12.1]